MLCTLITKARTGDADAMLQVIHEFQPLLLKYTRKLGYEDAYSDLILFFIELVHKIPEQLILKNNIGKLIKYITTSTKNHYYYLLKKNTFSSIEINTSQLSDEQVYYLENLLSITDHTMPDDIFYILKDYLTKKELHIIILIYYLGYTSTEIAHKEHVTRQAVNQLKQRALDKLKKALLKEL